MTDTSSQSIEQLELLGYQQGEQVYSRAIADDQPRKLSFTFPNIPPGLATLNNKGFNIYFVVNGGGDTDKDVKTCKAIFYEHDDRPKEEQIHLWESFGLPEPTFQVDTGGKSIHSYWVLDEPIASDLWKPLQTDLLNFSDADRANKNLSRVMRLAGFRHYKKGVASDIATIVSRSGKRYSYDLLRSIVPLTPVVVRERKQKQERKIGAMSSVKPNPKNTTTHEYPVPLEMCLALSNRDLLRGVSEGGRNDSGATLARDLIGSESYLQTIGIAYSGDARSLFNDFCDRCTPFIDDAENQAIWNSASSDFPEPSCPPEAFANILKAWNKENDPNYVEPPEERKLGYYTSLDNGLVLVHRGKNADGEPIKVTTKIGNHLEAIAVVDSPEQNKSALLVEFKTFQNHVRRVVILRSDLAGDGTEIIAMLLGLGYAFKRKHKAPLLDYLHGLGTGINRIYTVTDSTGWVGKSFVLPHKTYGDVDLRYRDIDPNPDVITEVKGTLDGWKANVAAHCAGNSRLILALGSSFAAPLLPIVDVESGGFHLVGATSQGKTTILAAGASVTGLKTVSSWRTTDNALEGGLAASNHLCLPLDELNQADPRKVGAIVYMLGNGIGKGRSTKEGTNRKSKVWQTMVLSSGETTIGKFMELAGESLKGGQEVRLPCIPAIPKNSVYGCFETIHGASTSAQFVSALDASVKAYRGTAIDAFLTRLVIDVADPTFASNLVKQVQLIAAKLCEGTKDSAIGRVAKRFALVQVSLGLAHKYDLLPFGVEQISWGVSQCFHSWLSARGGDGSIEVKNAVDRIEHLLVTNEYSDRVFTLPENNDRTVRNLLAYRKLDFTGMTEEFWIPLSVFDKEFCEGVNKTELVKELQRLGWLIPVRKDGRSNHQRSIKGKAAYYYVFGNRESIDEADGENNAGDSTPCSIDVIDSADSTYSPDFASESNKCSTTESVQSLPYLPLPSTAFGRQVDCCNPLVASVSDLPSIPSMPSMPKTHIGSSIAEKKPLKIGDRVKPIDIYHFHGSHIGEVFSMGDWLIVVKWNDGSDGRYSDDELKLVAEKLIH